MVLEIVPLYSLGLNVFLHPWLNKHVLITTTRRSVMFPESVQQKTPNSHHSTGAKSSLRVCEDFSGNTHSTKNRKHISRNLKISLEIGQLPVFKITFKM